MRTFFFRYFLRRSIINTIIAMSILLTMSVLLLLHSTPTQAEEATAAPITPAAPLLTSVTQSDGYTTVTWQPAQPGTYPIKSYRLLRSDDDGATYSTLATIDSNQTTYNDTTSPTISFYEVVADDDQDPAHSSPASDSMRATPAGPVAQPASKIGGISPASPAPTITQDAIDIPQGAQTSTIALQNTAALTQQTAPIDDLLQKPLTDKIARSIGEAGSLRVAQLQSAINTNNVTLIQPLLNRFSYEKLHIYEQRGSLSKQQQQELSQQCSEQSRVLETSLLTVPEPNQLDTLTAIASCEILSEQ